MVSARLVPKDHLLSCSKQVEIEYTHETPVEYVRTCGETSPASSGIRNPMKIACRLMFAEPTIRTSHFVLGEVPR